MSDSSILRVAIDATATPDQLTGAGFYVQEIIRELDARNNISLFIITRKNDRQRFEVMAPASKIISASPDLKGARIAFQTLQLGKLVDALDVDVFHGPHYQIPMRMETPSVVTIHDTTLLTHKDAHTKVKSLFFSRMIPVSLKKAACAIAVSQSTADDIERLFPFPKNVFVAPLGLDSQRFFPRNKSVTNEDETLLLKNRGISGKYIAFLGVLEPRKSVPTLIESFTRIAHDFPDHKLVLAGGDGWGIKEIRESIATSGLSSRIVLPGRLEDNEVGPFLRNADVFVYPSVYEGFGLPVLEAMACGVPVITTNNSSLKEVAGKGALLVEPNDVNQLSEAMTSMLRDELIRKQMIKRGLERAQDFSWERCVDTHVEAYKFACS